jgi:5-methylthioadenosine/S-adenosylhomocysteine deaminase
VGAHADEYFDAPAKCTTCGATTPLVATAFAPHAPYTVSDANFERIRMLSDQLDVPVHCHVHETAHEVAESQAQHGSVRSRAGRLGWSTIA